MMLSILQCLWIFCLTNLWLFFTSNTEAKSPASSTKEMKQYTLKGKAAPNQSTINNLHSHSLTGFLSSPQLHVLEHLNSLPNESFGSETALAACMFFFADPNQSRGDFRGCDKCWLQQCQSVQYSSVHPTAGAVGVHTVKEPAKLWCQVLGCC